MGAVGNSAILVAMKRFRHVIALLLVLACAGQSLLAVGAPCAMSGDVQQMMAGMEHSAHHDMGSAGDGAGACCEGGLCSMSHCQSAAAMLQAGVAERFPYAGPWQLSYPGASPEYAVESLFRPPISR